MPTHLALCVQLHSDCRVAGSLATTVAQTGMLKRIVDSIIKSNRDIQRAETNWKFLWSQWELTLVESTSEYSPPSGIGTFDQTSFILNAGTTSATPVNWIDHKRWRDEYQNAYTTEGEPQWVTVKPDGKLAVLPIPDSDSAGDKITCDYWKAPVDLVNNADTTLIPAQFQDVIIELARMYFADKMNNNGMYLAAKIKFDQFYPQLEAHQLPGKEDDRKSEASITRVIEVE